MTESADAPDSPYRAPVAPLECADSDQVISEQAMHSLVSSKVWMRIAGVALMVNGGLIAIAALWLGWLSVAEREALPGRPFNLVAIVLLLAGFRIFHPGLRLVQSSVAITRAALSKEERDIAFALQRHQEFWKSLGFAFVMILLVFLLFSTFLSR